VIVRSRAPLRISLAGGGTDLHAYSDLHGGGVLNAAIDMNAYATITPRRDDRIVIQAIDRDERLELEAESKLDVDGTLDLAKGVYNRIVKDYHHGAPLSFEMQTSVDAPAGSGLGSSSTLVVAMIGAFVRWLQLPLGEYEIADLACVVERVDLGFAGGRQDQYAATFGGWNFMEFFPGNRVLVNPLRIRSSHLQELEFNLVLYYTGTSRLSSSIIERQISNLEAVDGAGGTTQSLDAMHHLKEQAFMMKEALLKGELDRIGEILDYGWVHKKNTAAEISNEQIEDIYGAAIRAGASGGKISGAGGGGYIIFYCPGNTRYRVIDALRGFGGEIHRMSFDDRGLSTWQIR
jgi:D-glycero-alpha-D-manno-heptose-7-phosphate kinase